MALSREVVITGIGVVSPIGVGKDAFWQSLCERRSGVGVFDLFAASDHSFRIVAAVKDFDPKEYVKPRKSLKVMCREIQIGYAAAALAMDDAGLKLGSYDPDRLGVLLGSELYQCEVDELEDAYRHCIKDGQYHHDLWGSEGMSLIYPLWMLKHLPNMAACHIGIAHDARGPNNTITLEEASSLTAVIESAEIIRRGWADIMITGGAGSRIVLSDMVFHGDLDLSHRIHEPQAASRPFDAARDGMVLGEGAGTFILESRSHAESRGAPIVARLLGQGQAFETCSAQEPGRGLRNAIQSALRSAGLSSSDIGHVKAHGRSTVEDDIIEAQAIHDVLGNTPVTAPTSYFGYLGAGGGAVEMATSVLSIVHGEVPVTLNYETPDPKCPVNVVHDEPLRTDKQTAVVLNRAEMGQNVAIILAAP